jgi:hypothetical protein
LLLLLSSSQLLRRVSRQVSSPVKKNNFKSGGKPITTALNCLASDKQVKQVLVLRTQSNWLASHFGSTPGFAVNFLAEGAVQPSESCASVLAPRAVRIRCLHAVECLQKHFLCVPREALNSSLEQANAIAYHSCVEFGGDKLLVLFFQQQPYELVLVEQQKPMEQLQNTFNHP